MSDRQLQFHHVTFRYDTSPQAVFEDISLHLTPGWTGIVGANGTGKTTLLKLAASSLEPDDGLIQAPRRAVYCPQRTDAPPERFDAFLSADAKSAALLKQMLRVQENWAARWETLSHGERKRAQIAVALWQEPDLLAIDEPTNHIDAEARGIVSAALHTYEGIGLLVSHDRELLDALCQQCVFVEPPVVMLRSGGVSKGMAQSRHEQESLKKEARLKKQAYKQLQREAVRRRQDAQQADKKRSKRHIDRHDHDAKGKIDAARVSGKDAVAGKLLRQLDGRLRHAQQQAESIHVNKEYATGIWLPGSCSPRDILAEFPASCLRLGGEKELFLPRLVVLPTDRIGMTGANGSGKSTLIRAFLESLRLETARVTYIPQEIGAEQSRQILADIQRLPRQELGQIMTIISRLGSRPQRLLDSAEPSPGELRKLLLALGVLRSPHLIILDEPTNHMDLVSIQCLEEALADCPCALMLVSHDTYLLDKLTTIRWHISQSDALKPRCELHVL